MPSLGADMEAGTLVAWHKAAGDTLERGDTLAAVDTDKGVIDVEIFRAGVLEEILVAPGTRVPVGTPLARIREPGEPPREPEVGADLQSAQTTPHPPREPSLQPAKLAPQLAAPSSLADRMRRSIAAAMTRSKREIPHYYLWTTIDLAAATEWLASVNAERPIERRLLPGVLLLKATAVALEEFPEFSAVWEEDRLAIRMPAHVGVAISLRGGGLVVLALHDTAARPLDDLMDGLRDLTARVRSAGQDGDHGDRAGLAGRMRSSELADTTITVTSLGDRGVEGVLGVIYPPQVALVGFGRIGERPCVVKGAVVARPAVTASLSADHRASDGHRGGLFLAAIDRLVQEPERL
jgi:pyruvate dehydrogenase E2 component (dihydrolipoamide acetyltransferase)